MYDKFFLYAGPVIMSIYYILGSAVPFFDFEVEIYVILAMIHVSILFKEFVLNRREQ